jgi:hypothetical protein
MPGLKVTVGAAMRARDVSRPRPDQNAAAEEAIAALPMLRSAQTSRLPPLGRDLAAPAPFPPRRPAPPAPRPAAVPVPAPPPAPPRLDDSAAPPASEPGPADVRDEESAASQEPGTGGTPAGPRPAKRKRVRRRKGHGR